MAYPLCNPELVPLSSANSLRRLLLNATKSSESVFSVWVFICGSDVTVTMMQWLEGEKVICIPVALPASTSANTPAEGNHRSHLHTRRRFCHSVHKVTHIYACRLNVVGMGKDWTFRVIKFRCWFECGPRITFPLSLTLADTAWYNVCWLTRGRHHHSAAAASALVCTLWVHLDLLLFW